MAEFPSTDGKSVPGTKGESALDGSELLGAVGVAVEGVAVPDEPAPVVPRGGIVVVVGEVGADEDDGAGSDGSDGTDTPGLVDPLPVIGASGELEPVIGPRSDVAPEIRLETDPVSEDPSGTTAAVRTAVAGPEE